MKAHVGHALLPGALLLACASTAAAARTPQDSASSGLRGLVVTMPGDGPVAAALVTVLEARRAATATDKGEYEFTRLVPGRYNVSVRKLGFMPLVAQLDIADGKVTEADLELEVMKAQMLERVTVAERQVDLNGLDERRRTNAGGSFITAQLFDSVRGKPLQEVMEERMPDVKIVRPARTGAALLATSRGTSSFNIKPLEDPRDKKSATGCFSQIYLDGVRIYAPGTNQLVPDLNLFDTRDIQAIEFYPGPATTPIQHGGSYAVCETLLIWHKMGGP